MSDTAVHYEVADGIATIRIDDGKRNALAPSVLEAIYAALDRAEADGARVILTGREGVFSAGFHLKVLRGGGMPALRMLRLGYGLTARVLGYPHPVIVACNGHCFAMGVFMMLAADHVIGSSGEFRVSANEVAIGLPMPRVAAAMLQHRLQPGAFQRAVTLATEFDVAGAREAGFFDEVVEPAELMTRARERAEQFEKLDAHAHAVSKRRIRRALIRRIRRQLPLDLIEAALIGLRASRKR